MSSRQITIKKPSFVKSKAAANSAASKQSHSITNPIQKITKHFRSSRQTQQIKKLTKNELINAESALGRTIFGPIPAGHQREFFHYQQNIWLWHESWLDTNGQRRSSTVRYEVRPSGVFKRIGRSAYHKITGAELANFRKATHRYLDLVKTNLYNKNH